MPKGSFMRTAPWLAQAIAPHNLPTSSHRLSGRAIMRQISKISHEERDIAEARDLRENIVPKLFPRQNTEQANKKLAQLLNCQRDDCLFFHGGEDHRGKTGVEEHVLDGLRKLASPYGHTY